MKLFNLSNITVLWVTLTVVIGTIAVIVNLSFRKKKKKNIKPQLVCNSNFSFGHFASGIKPKHKIILKSISDEMVIVSFIRYYINPRGFWRKLFKERTWKNKSWIYDDKPRDGLDIYEDEQAEISINLPAWVTITDVLKVDVYDRSGRAYSVQWPSTEQLAVLVHYEVLYESEESSKDRVCKIIGYAASGDYHMYTNWDLTSKHKNSSKGKIFHFKNKNTYENKLKDIIMNQRPKLLINEIDEIT
jgi:hypothetical protein